MASIYVLQRYKDTMVGQMMEPFLVKCLNRNKQNMSKEQSLQLFDAGGEYMFLSLSILKHLLKALELTSHCQSVFGQKNLSENPKHPKTVFKYLKPFFILCQKSQCSHGCDVK